VAVSGIFEPGHARPDERPVGGTVAWTNVIACTIGVGLVAGALLVGTAVFRRS
jgi:hypothetical protein